MDTFDLIKGIVVETGSKIIYLVIDGLGGLPETEDGKSEMEKANIPNLDMLAAKSICGMIYPVMPGITPGSGPGHLSLFGYDPIKYSVGRGVLEALGIGHQLELSDVAVRMNFVTTDEDGVILDRRAGRMKTEECAELCRLLSEISINGVSIVVKPVMDYRAVMIMKGADLGDYVTDSDPQKNGIKPREIKALYPEAENLRTADIANEFVHKTQEILKERNSANMVVLRGFARYQKFPSMYEVYKLKAASIATYPMYRGVTGLIGMEILPTGDSLTDELNTLSENFDRYNFFYLHVKKADSAGEDGDFDRKIKVLEDVDKKIPFLMELKPDVIVVTGDHSTPSVLKSHSWHPVPLMIYSKWCGPDQVRKFSERDCTNGGLGHILAKQAMPIVMANALKLDKYGA